MVLKEILALAHRRDIVEEVGNIFVALAVAHCGNEYHRKHKEHRAIVVERRDSARSGCCGIAGHGHHAGILGAHNLQAVARRVGERLGEAWLIFGLCSSNRIDRIGRYLSLLRLEHLRTLHLL